MNPTDGVLSEAWGLYKRHWQHLFLIAFAVYAVLAVVSVVLVVTLTWVGAILAGIVSLVGVFLLQGALITAVDDIRDGRADLSVGETFQRVRPVLGSIIVAGLLTGLGVALGLILLIIPGLVLLTWWSAVLPVVVLERRRAGEAFGRSRELVRGHGWNVFGVIVLTILVLIGASIILEIVLSPLADWLQSFVSDIVSGTVVTPFAAVAWSLIYFRLRQAKEPVDAPGPPTPSAG